MTALAVLSFPGFRSEPNPDRDSLVETLWFKDDGTPLCSSRRRRCWKCQHHYAKEERALEVCPECGTARFCRQVVAQAGGRCKYHGGNTPVGAAVHNFKHGRYSRHMPARLRDKYLESSRDTELLNVRQEISLLDARVADLLGRVDVGDSGKLFIKAREAFIGFRDALDRGDTETTRIHLQTLDRLLSQGQGDYAAWEDIRGALEQRRKLVETEIRRLEKMGQIITAEELQTFLHAIAAIAKRLIKDQNLLNDFVREILALGTR